MLFRLYLPVKKFLERNRLRIERRHTRLWERQVGAPRGDNCTRSRVGKVVTAGRDGRKVGGGVSDHADSGRRADSGRCVSAPSLLNTEGTSARGVKSGDRRVSNFPRPERTRLHTLTARPRALYLHPRSGTYTSAHAPKNSMEF